MIKLFCKLIITIVIITVMQLCCSTQGVSGSETTNGFRVAVVKDSISGTALPNRMIMCFSNFYNQDSSKGFADTINTDSHGNFGFKVTDTLIYNLFTYSSNGDSCALLQNLNVRSGDLDTLLTFNTALNLNGSICINKKPVSDATVYIVGTPFKTISDVDGKFKFNAVPSGTFTMKSTYDKRNTNGILNGSVLLSPSNSWGDVITIELK